MLVDSLAHLQDARILDLPALLERARSAGVTDIVSGGVDPLCDDIWRGPSLPGLHVWSAFGIHPATVGQRPLAVQLNHLRAKLQSLHVVAIGECGLDQRPGMPPLEKQKDAFVAQLELACELGLPVILHQVRATEPLLRLLQRRDFSGLRGMIHGYSGSAESVRELVAAGISISFGASLTSERHRRARSALLAVPDDALLVESDAPDHPPATSGRPQSEPSDLLATLHTMATLRATSIAHVHNITARNAAKLFRIPERAAAPA